MTTTKSTVFAWSVMTIFVCLEALAGVVLLGYTIVGFSNRGDADFMQSVSILIVTVVAAFWVGATFLALTRKRGWARGSALTIQIFIFSVAVGAFQGFYAQPLIGWMLAVPAVITFVAALVARPEHAPTVSPSDAEIARELNEDR